MTRLQQGNQLKLNNFSYQPLGTATHASSPDQEYYGFAGWMKAQGLISESLGTSMSMRYGPPRANAFSSAARKVFGDVTRAALTPKDSASLTKSGLTRSDATTRPSKRSS